MTAPASTDENTVPMVPWDNFVASFAWFQGEHVALIGPTGSGKTNLAYWLLPFRKYVTVFATKPKDDSLVKFGRHNRFKTMQQWSDARTAEAEPRRIVWPNARTLSAVDTQRKVFDTAFKRIFVQGGWCLYIDELWYMCQILGFDRAVKLYLLQARSIDISLVVATQRPAWIPVEVYDQSTHLFFWKDSDKRNLQRLSDLSTVNTDLIKSVVARLPKYHVLYVNTRNDVMAITRPPAPQKG